jgi:soluble lytic murein transglycosylase-like protein
VRRFFAALVLAVLGFPPALAAQDSAPSGPVFKRVAAPKPGEKPKITVQIDPDEYFAYFNPPPEEEEEQSPPATVPPQVGPPLPHGPFWQAFISRGQPMAMDQIEDALRLAPAGQPRLSHLQDIANAHARDILVSTVGTQVSPALVVAVISVESAGKADAVSHAGAQGLMQLIPATADRFGVKDATDPGQNIAGGVRYLDWLMREFKGNPVHVLAAYNAGENAVKGHNGAPPFQETRAYVPKVLAAWQVARGLCITPPELISDGCVLKTGEVASGG